MADKFALSYLFENLSVETLINNNAPVEVLDLKAAHDYQQKMDVKYKKEDIERLSKAELDRFAEVLNVSLASPWTTERLLTILEYLDLLYKPNEIVFTVACGSSDLFCFDVNSTPIGQLIMDTWKRLNVQDQKNGGSLFLHNILSMTVNWEDDYKDDPTFSQEILDDISKELGQKVERADLGQWKNPKSPYKNIIVEKEW